jgi:arylsulfatase A-like enzyme
MFVRWIAVVVGLMVWVPRGETAAARPNFIIIMADHLGREWLGCYGGEGLGTPNIDQLANSGTRFETCYSSSHSSVSQVEFLTGRYPFRTGWVWHNDVPRWGNPYFDWENETTFARPLRTAGYHTAMFGDWRLNALRTQPDALKMHGFDEHRVWVHAESEEGEADVQQISVNGAVRNLVDDGSWESMTRSLTNFVGRFRDERFLAYMQFPMSLPSRKEPGGYRAAVRTLDQTIGEVVSNLEALRIHGRTVVILTSASGSLATTTRAWGERVRGGQGSMRDVGINVPMIVRGSYYVRAGEVIKAGVDFSDVFPSLLEMAGVLRPRGRELDGHSFAGYLRGGGVVNPRAWVFSQYGYDRVIRHGPYKVYRNGLMFDMSDDLLERHNIGASGVSEVVGVGEGLMRVMKGLPKDRLLKFPVARRMVIRQLGQ